MRSFLAFALLLAAVACAAASPPASNSGLPPDARLGALKDLNGYFPFKPPNTKEEWDKRAEYVRRRALVALGLWPTPTKTPLNAVIHGKIEQPGYSVEKVYFESAPGFFVTGNLYRPTKIAGKVPGVLFAHGHWKDARLSEEKDDNLRREIAGGQERFERGGRSRFQSMCVQLARMGCVVWQWDMLSDSDSIQFSADVIHGFRKQRPELNTTENWGLFSPQADAHLQSVMGLQAWNSIRSLDFLLSLPEVDPERVAMTGASGGGTQTMILAAIDPRLKLSFPAVMVSTAMQGGCTCENASLLRIGTGNVEFAALFAPKPQGMTTADDWTKEMSTKGFPDLQQLYKLLDAPDQVSLARGEHFPHNYNAVSRSAFYTWLNKHFKLGAREPVIEQDYEPLERDQLTVWDKDHPAPKSNDIDFERQLLKWFADDAHDQLQALAKQNPDSCRQTIAGAIEVLVGRTFSTAGEVQWESGDKTDRGEYLQIAGLLRNQTYDEALPVVWAYPKQWKGRVVVWLADEGKATLLESDGKLNPAVEQLVHAGTAVVGADLLYQGKFLQAGRPLEQTRVVENGREAPAYTFGYNHSLFAQRAHDVLTIVRFLRTAKIDSHPSPSSVGVAGFGTVGPVVLAARVVAEGNVDRAAVDTSGFRFAKLLDYRNPMFLPGGAKYFDLPGMIAIAQGQPLWVAGETEAKVHRELAPSAMPTTFYTGDVASERIAAAKWLLE